MTKTDKLNKLALAANCLRSAKAALHDVAYDQGYVSADAKYYAAEIGELLACDNGEGGLVALIALVSKELEK